MLPKYDLLRSVFEEYALDEKGAFSMGLNEFSVFAMDACIPDNSSDFCRQGDLDTLFIMASKELQETNNRLKKVGVNRGVPGRSHPNAPPPVPQTVLGGSRPPP
jgi:hypothetical protein